MNYAIAISFLFSVTLYLSTKTFKNRKGAKLVAYAAEAGVCISTIFYLYESKHVMLTLFVSVFFLLSIFYRFLKAKRKQNETH